MSADPKDKGQAPPAEPPEEKPTVDKETGMAAEWTSGKAAGKTKHVNIIIVSWREKGRVVLGRFIKAEELAESKFEQKVMRYLLETDEGLVSCVLGATIDKEVLPTLKVGDLLRIEYHGKQDLGDGRSVNVFDIQKMGAK